VLVTPSRSLAQPSPVNLDAFAQREFERRDRNGDGLLDERETPDGLRRDFRRWDTSGDGKISLLEMKRFMHARAQQDFAEQKQRWAPLAAGEGEEFERLAVKEFQRRDRDRNDLLAGRELPDNLRDRLGQWDLNADGQLTLSEYKGYVRDQARERLAEVTKRAKEIDRWAVPVVEVDAVEEADRVAVYRAGQLPREVPSWFPELDANRDAQVSLAEWLRGDKPAREFRAMDRNDDGLLTVAELLRHLRLTGQASASEEGEILLRDWREAP
jgi:Ca2+-binding EF-hand superfamily protein